jgi:hypothetical protein
MVVARLTFGVLLFVARDSHGDPSSCGGGGNSS